jgi:hypothetical protein
MNLNLTLVTQIALNGFVGAAAGDMDFCRSDTNGLFLIIAGRLYWKSRVDATLIQRNIEKLIVDAEKSALLGNAFVCNHYGLPC